LLVDKVDILMPELVLRGFIVCLDTQRAHGDFGGKDGLSPIHHEERRLSHGLGGCWPRALTACAEPQAPLIITGLGQFSAALAGEVNKALVRGVHRPGPQPPIQKC
jgi:hypothetical protein